MNIVNNGMEMENLFSLILYANYLPYHAHTDYIFADYSYVTVFICIFKKYFKFFLYIFLENHT